jgi:hypothetical protein
MSKFNVSYFVVLALSFSFVNSALAQQTAKISGKLMNFAVTTEL